MKAVQVREPGGPEKMETVDVPVPVPGPGQALVRIAASGVNFIDIYIRSGLYQSDLPITLGSEAAGTVESIGPNVTHVAPGDRVAYAMVRGSYAEYAAVPETSLVKIPDTIDFESAAAAMLQGMTAHYLTNSTFPLNTGQSCLVHAAAGGAGRLTAQMAKIRGARVIGTVSTEEKAAVAAKAGVDHPIVYTAVDFEAEVKRITGGTGVDVVYDSVGKTTFDKSLACLRPRGMMVLFGQSSGPVTAFEPQILNTRGSIFLTRPSLAHYLLSREELLWRAGDVFTAIERGELALRVDHVFPLAEAGAAHRALESRATTGKLILTTTSLASNSRE